MIFVSNPSILFKKSQVLQGFFLFLSLKLSYLPSCFFSPNVYFFSGRNYFLRSEECVCVCARTRACLDMHAHKKETDRETYRKRDRGLRMCVCVCVSVCLYKFTCRKSSLHLLRTILFKLLSLLLCYLSVGDSRPI